MWSPGEEVGARENNEMAEAAVEDEIQIPKLYQLLPHNHYHEISKRSNGRWLFSHRSLLRHEHSEGN